jgi:hypothetical protein
LVRGLTLEELRAFLTSVLVIPARSRNWLEWFRRRAKDRVEPGPVAVAKTDPPPASAPSGAGK